MAVKEFNCNKLKRTFWPFTLKDKVDENGNVVEKGKKIVVRMPQKKVFEAIKEIPDLDEDNATAEDTEAIYRLVAAVLNNNMGKVPVTEEDVADYDIEECTAILNAYMEYIDKGIFLKLTNKDLPVKGKRKKHNKRVRVQKRASAGESIENRPDEVKDREIFGHWEMDTVKGKQGVTKSCMLVLTERKTRDEIIVKLPDQKAASVVEAIDRLERKWGDMFTKVFRSITVDNGVEFSDYEGLERSVLHEGEKRTFAFYCHPYSSWERGSNENNNRLIRRHIPKGEDFDEKQDRDIEYIENWINNYPRGIFGFKTSAQLFEEEIKKLA